MTRPVVGLVVPVHGDARRLARNEKRRAARSLAEHERGLAIARHQKRVAAAEHVVARAAMAWYAATLSPDEYAHTGTRLLIQMSDACAALANLEGK